ncbi:MULTISPECIES: cold-inducible protein YdjO-related protein [unclassified Paenibacillus]|uniref:cold-inducible protein YdjO-related protein n=1 Tax=unclassified Paenibacillus TaxID=185978 RepID=UPI001C12546D|nr:MULTISPECIES: cold-inducible protein YdjO-related protein [unclassified Paenibacillus]MBU5442806.1 cold-shock protein [Paenibacillus sp. MSJ-34]CAH0117879.1 hypothetical protein PAE9249_00342 [Paenibacillus sp. CECT 9249]
MYRKKEKQRPSETETDVWICTHAACNGWMRAEFTFDEKPEELDCPLCGSPMERGVKMLPQM